jgi:hypothetical protein
MARFLLQAVNNEDHLAPAREVFGLAGLQSAAISTAFMTAAGLSLLEGVLQPIAARTRIFVGIRNGVTTVQGIQKALEIGCETFMVDTGTRQRIFHPKLYFARSAARARLLLGSANLTMGGMRTNIEASVLQDFDPVADAAFLHDLEGKLAAMIADYPEHVFRAVDADQLAGLMQSGRLLDERKARPTEPAGSSANRALDTLSRMALRTAPIAVPKAAPPPMPVPPPAAVPAPGPIAGPAAPVPAMAAQQPTEEAVLLWTSKPLKRAHINLPNNAGTNAKGALSLTAGLYEDVNPRVYFRQSAFAGLNWGVDAHLPYKERTHADFRVVVKGINYGVHSLRISHDTRTNTPNFLQNNYTTSLHWGDTARFVAHEDILGRTLRIYRESDNPLRFLLDID